MPSGVQRPHGIPAPEHPRKLYFITDNKVLQKKYYYFTIFYNLYCFIVYLCPDKLSF